MPLGSYASGGQTFSASGNPTGLTNPVNNPFPAGSPAGKVFAKGLGKGGDSELYAAFEGLISQLNQIPGIAEGLEGVEEGTLYSELTGLPFVNKDIPGLFQELIQKQKTGEGVLGSVQQDRNFGALAASLMDQYRAENAQVGNAMGQAGVNRAAIARTLGADPFRALRQVAAARAQTGAQRAQDIYAADQGLANLYSTFADTELQRAKQEGQYLNYLQAIKGLAKDAQKNNLLTAGIGALGEGISAYIGNQGGGGGGGGGTYDPGFVGPPVEGWSTG